MGLLLRKAKQIYDKKKIFNYFFILIFCYLCKTPENTNKTGIKTMIIIHYYLEKKHPYKEILLPIIIGITTFLPIIIGTE